MLPNENEVIIARGGFADTQEDIRGSSTVIGQFTVGWYGTSVNEERGAFAVVNRDGPLLNYVGDFLSVRRGQRTVYVYVFGSASIIADIGLARRAYLGLSLLAHEPISAEVGLL